MKEVARKLLATLKQEKLVLDWRKRQQSRAEVRLAIAKTLDKLPEAFNKQLSDSKCDRVYQHVYDSYSGKGLSAFETA